MDRYKQGDWEHHCFPGASLKSIRTETAPLALNAISQFRSAQAGCGKHAALAISAKTIATTRDDLTADLRFTVSIVMRIWLGIEWPLWEP